MTGDPLQERRPGWLRSTGRSLFARAGRAPFSAPMAVPDFRRLTGAYLVNELGNWAGEIALALVVYNGTGSALATAGLFLCARFLPALGGPALVARVQLIAARQILPALYAAEAALFIALAFVARGFSLVPLLILAALDGVVAIAAKALSRTAVTATLAPGDELRAGNALLNVGFTFVAALGPALAGLLIAWVGTSTALLVDAASFAGAALFLLSLRLPPAAPDAHASWRQRLRAGLSYAARAREVRTLLIAQGIALVFFAATPPIEVVLVKRVFHGSDAGYGALLSAWGAGMAIGGVLFAALRSARLGVVIVAATSAIGVAYLGIALAPTLLAAAAWSVLGGIGNGAQWVAVLTALQHRTRREMLAGVMGLFEALSSLAPGLGFVLGGVAASVDSPRLSFAIAGAGILVVVVGAAAALRSREPIATTVTDP